MTQEEFIRRAHKTHGDTYDYSKVNYVDCYTNVCIICPIHGEFMQQAGSHLAGCGCPKCACEERVAKRGHGRKPRMSRNVRLQHVKVGMSAEERVKRACEQIAIIKRVYGVNVQSIHSADPVYVVDNTYVGALECLDYYKVE